MTFVFSLDLRRSACLAKEAKQADLQEEDWNEMHMENGEDPWAGRHGHGRCRRSPDSRAASEFTTRRRNARRTCARKKMEAATWLQRAPTSAGEDSNRR